jgi:hypothetical protein
VGTGAVPPVRGGDQLLARARPGVVADHERGVVVDDGQTRPSPYPPRQVDPHVRHAVIIAVPVGEPIDDCPQALAGERWRWVPSQASEKGLSMRTTTVRRLLHANAALALALTLAACDPGDGPDDPPTDAGSSEPTPTADPTTDASTDPTEPATTREPPDIEAPTPPAEMQQDDINGAAAATYYFLSLYDYMQATGDTSQWDAMSANCEWCVGTRDLIAGVYEEGGWIENGGLTFDITLSEVEYPGDGQDFYVTRLTVVEDPYVTVSSDGSVSESDGSTLDPMAIAVQFQAGGGYEVVAVNYA